MSRNKVVLFKGKRNTQASGNVPSGCSSCLFSVNFAKASPPACAPPFTHHSKGQQGALTYRCDSLPEWCSLLESTQHLFWAGVGRILCLANAMRGKTWFLHWEIVFIFSVVILTQMYNLTCQILTLIHLLIFCCVFSSFFLDCWIVHFCKPIRWSLLLPCSWKQKCICLRTGCSHLRLQFASLRVVCGVFLPSQYSPVPVSTGVLSVHATYIHGSVSHVISFLFGDDSSILSLIRSPNC